MTFKPWLIRTKETEIFSKNFWTKIYLQQCPPRVSFKNCPEPDKLRIEDNIKVVNVPKLIVLNYIANALPRAGHVMKTAFVSLVETN